MSFPNPFISGSIVDLSNYLFPRSPIFFSSLFLLLFLFQLLSHGLCQLHSISACLGSICLLHSSSLVFLMCRTKSFIYSSKTNCFSLGSLISLLWNSSEYSTTLCRSISFWHHWNSFSALIYLVSSSLPTM